jgi:hypothetical protein
MIAPGAVGDDLLIADDLIAARLEHQLHKFRELAREHEAAGNVCGIDARVFSPLSGENRGRGRPAQRRFYSEADALFLVTRSKAPKAIALTKEMVRVYRLAVRGLLVPADSRTAAQLRADNERLRAENGTLRERAVDEARSFTTGTIASLTLRVSILSRVVHLTRLKTGLTSGPVFNAACSAMHRDVKRVARVDVAWPQLPVGRLGDVTAAIDLVEHQLRRDARVRDRSRQLALVPRLRPGSAR